VEHLTFTGSGDLGLPQLDHQPCFSGSAFLTGPLRAVRPSFLGYDNRLSLGVTSPSNNQPDSRHSQAKAKGRTDGSVSHPTGCVKN
jgi:hypothetical protein